MLYFISMSDDDYDDDVPEELIAAIFAICNRKSAGCAYI